MGEGGRGGDGGKGGVEMVKGGFGRAGGVRSVDSGLLPSLSFIARNPCSALLGALIASINIHLSPYGLRPVFSLLY